METPHAVGIDVSKATLDLARYPSGELLQVANTPDGWIEAVAWITANPPDWIVLEATGRLHVGLTVALAEAGLPTSVVNPAAVRHFARSLGRHAKTDQIDAAVLARFGVTTQPMASPVPSERVRVLQALLTRHEQLAGDIATERTRLSSAPVPVRESITTHITWLQSQITAIDAALARELAEDAELSEQATRYRTVPGIGPHIASVLILQLPELGTGTRKELAALVGVAPFARDSGVFRGKRVTYGGRALVRKALYQAVTSANRCNPVIQTFYRRLRAAGKPHKVAMVAAMNKLTGLLHAMARDGLTWTELAVNRPTEAIT